MAKKNRNPVQQQNSSPPAATGWQNMPGSNAAPSTAANPGMSPANLIARSQARQQSGYDPFNTSSMNDQQLGQFAQSMGFSVAPNSDMSQWRQWLTDPSTLNKTMVGGTNLPGQSGATSSTETQQAGGTSLGQLGAMMQAAASGQQQPGTASGTASGLSGPGLPTQSNLPQGGTTLPQGSATLPQGISTAAPIGMTPTAGFSQAPSVLGNVPSGLGQTSTTPQSYLSS